MKYVVAVSGGVDSVVLLDMLVSGKFGKHDLIVAHFDHGIRPDSMDDAAFVRQLAAEYGLSFETKREELGRNASEELARDRRYAFLRQAAERHKAVIVTAHHADDMIETIAINLTRGTGWRGLAVLDSPGIWRPLLDMTKQELKAYAEAHKLEWREDATNQDTKYLRNDLRQKLVSLDEDSRELLRLYRNRQVVLKREIDEESAHFIGESPYRRYPFITVDEPVAMELLRAVCVRETGMSPTRPQLTRALHAVKVYYAGKVFPVGPSMEIRFTKTHFVVQTKDKMI